MRPLELAGKHTYTLAKHGKSTRPSAYCKSTYPLPLFGNHSSAPPPLMFGSIPISLFWSHTRKAPPGPSAVATRGVFYDIIVNYNDQSFIQQYLYLICLATVNLSVSRVSRGWCMHPTQAMAPLQHFRLSTFPSRCCQAVGHSSNKNSAGDPDSGYISQQTQPRGV